MNPRKYPRSLEEAFGPYQRGPVFDRDEDQMPFADRVAIYASAGGAVALAVFAVLGWIQ